MRGDWDIFILWQRLGRLTFGPHELERANCLILTAKSVEFLVLDEPIECLIWVVYRPTLVEFYLTLLKLNAKSLLLLRYL